MPTTDEQLLRQAKNGDRSAFSKLVKPHGDGLAAWCLKFSRSREEAEDAAQDAVLRAWTSLPSFRGDCSFKSWLFRIATNTCLTRSQRNREVAVRPDHPLFLSQRDEAPPTAVRAMEACLLSQIRRHLSEDDERVFVGVYEMEMSSEEVSRLLLRDKSLGADGVRSRLQRKIRPQIAKAFAAMVTFGEGDLKSPRRLAARWDRPEDAVSAYIRTALASPAVHALRQTSAPPRGDEAVARVLVTGLNRVLRDTDLYEPARFAPVALRPETRYLAQQKQPLVALRNRLLLEDAYSQELYQYQP